MKEFLTRHGMEDVTPKYFWRGSMRGCWRFWSRKVIWDEQLRIKLTDLGFVGHDGKPLTQYANNGGIGQPLSLFVRGKDTFVAGVTPGKV